MADLGEIAANDFNLNISRYVDTTEPEDVMSVEDALAHAPRGGAQARRGDGEDGRNCSPRWGTAGRAE